MDYLRSLGSSVLLALLGLAILVGSLIDSLAIGSVQLDPGNSGARRIILAIVGGAVLLLSLALTLRRREPEIHDPRPAVDSVLQTLDSLPGLDRELADVRRLSVLSRTGVNLLMNYERALTAACASGCEIRFLFVDPKSPAAKFLYGKNSDLYDANLKTTMTALARLMDRIGPRLQVKVTDDVPAVSLVRFDYSSGGSKARVQLNFMHSRVGRDRPVIELGDTDSWFPAFAEEFDAFWHDARDLRTNDL